MIHHLSIAARNPQQAAEVLAARHDKSIDHPSSSEGSATMNPVDALCQHAECRPKSPAFFSGEATWTYERLAAEANRLAGSFVRLGIGKGDRVALHMPNLPELVVAYYACFQTGAIAAPLNLRFKTAELAPILARLKPALYLGHGELYPRVAELDPSILASERRFVVGGETGAPRARRWPELVANGSGQFSWPAPDPHAAALLLGTSGPTGLPKLVTHTLSTLSAIADFSAHLGVDGEQIGVDALPMVHMSGVATFFGCMRFGAPMALLERFDPDAVLDAIERHQCTWLFVLPFMAVELLERQRARPRNVSSLRTCVTAGDVRPPGLQEDFRSVFAVPLRSFWASTEATGAFTFGPCDGPVSAPVPGAQIQLLDDEGVPVRRGEVGELAVRGPNVAIGYWTAPGCIDDRRKDGWLLSGDLMRQDQEGNCWFVSRKKDLIIRGGSNIWPLEVERALLVHPAVRDAAVVGVPDAKLGQRVAGFVQLADGEPKIALAAIQADLAARLADYKIPERWVVIDRVPRNGLGKVDRNRLLTLLQTQAFCSKGPDVTRVSKIAGWSD